MPLLTTRAGGEAETGYAIVKDIEEQAGIRWDRGFLYAALRARLEEQGLCRGAAGQARRRRPDHAAVRRALADGWLRCRVSSKGLRRLVAGRDAMSGVAAQWCLCLHGHLRSASGTATSSRLVEDVGLSPGCC